jgi:hypothetical protein
MGMAIRRERTTERTCGAPRTPWGTIAATAALLTLASAAWGQAVVTASKTMDVSVFGGYNYLRPDYGPDHDNGVTVGANLTRYFRFPIKPSIETRISFNSGTTVNENTYLFGFRGQMDFHRYHPYVDFLVGPGDIHYNFAIDPNHPNSYRNDNSVVESPGIGIDIDLIRRFQFKGDYQYQYWNLGAGPHGALNPSAVTLGIAYRFPFKPRYEHAVH